MEFILKYKIILLRTIGIVMVIVGFAVHFWTAPKVGRSESDIAAANIARMEASSSGQSQSSKKSQNSKGNYLQKLKDKQKKQLEYLTIIAMVLGVGSLGYSFIKKEPPMS